MVQLSYKTLGRYSMGGGGGVLGAIVGAVIAVVGVVTGQPELVMMGLTMAASSIVSALTAPKAPTSNGTTQLNTGTNLQIQPATNNKLPIVYGNCYVGGTITDLSITSDNQNLYYVLSLCEVTGNGTDSIAYGNIYYGGKLCLFSGLTYTDSSVSIATISGNTITYSGTLSIPVTSGLLVSFANSGSPIYYTVSGINTTTNTIVFNKAIDPSVIVGNEMYAVNPGQSSSTAVTGLVDPATGLVDAKVNGYLNIYLYSNGSYNPVNSNQSAISVMQASGLTYQWDNSKLMTNCAFAIVHLTYNANAGVTSIAQTQFEVINSRIAPGDVIYDYLTSTVYGGAIPASQIDTASLTALNTYCAQTITFNNYLGVPETQPRFTFNGAIDTTKNILDNVQSIVNCCDCLLKYNEIYGVWSVIVNQPTYSVAMDINDSNMVSAIQVVSLDISNTYNIAQCQFPDISLNSSFNTSTVNLALVAPSLLYPNEPQNAQTIQLPLVNNDVQAQLLATRFLKAARMDLQITCTINYIGLELEAGDIVTVTNANYGFVAKLFRVIKVEQNFAPDGTISVALTLLVYDPSVYNDASVTQYNPQPNSGLPAPNSFGTIPAPVIANSLPNAANPSFQVDIKSSTNGIVQYAEIWYSAYSNPSPSQLIFAGTTAVQPNGIPYGNSVALPPVTLSTISAGNWYFFTRMVNSLETSLYSPPSSLFTWRPTTFQQYAERYLSIAYATSQTGTGFTSNPRGATYYGIANTNIPSFDLTPTDYIWYPANPVFGSSGTLNYLLFCNRGNNFISFATGNAAPSAGSALFVPTDPNYDPTIWQGLEDGYNIIDLNARTGQLIQTGTTTVGTGEIAVNNNPQGQVVASLAQLLTFPGGAQTYTSSVATLTVDVYGRVVGFVPPDTFNYTMTAFDASSGQTVFHVTRGTEYLSGNCLVFQNGLLLDPSEYTDTGGSTGNVTLAIGANLNDIITIISMASVAVSTSTTYNSFSRNSDTLSNTGSYTASGFTLVSGNELLFLNGTVINAQDYNISGQTISFVNAVSGDLQVIQWTNNNQGQPNGNPSNTDVYTIPGQATYPFTFNPLAFNLYNNGVLLLETVDYSVTTGSYTLAQTPTSNLNILVEQSFNRNGAV